MSSRGQAALAVLAVFLAAPLTYDGLAWLRASRANEAVRAGTVLRYRGPASAEVNFAQAYALAARGEPQRALTLYRDVAGAAGTDATLRAEALYNAGNLHLRQAIAARAAHSDGQAMTLFELAKQSYRDALSSNTAHWDARYNLERALRYAPETDEADLGEGPPLTRRRMPVNKHEMPLGPP
jgi:mxaK protein